MKPQKNRKIITFLKVLPLIVCIIFIVLFLATSNDITVETVLSYTPESPFTAAMIILFLYALKSISFVFPIVVLQIAAGYLFSIPTALYISFLLRTFSFLPGDVISLYLGVARIPFPYYLTGGLTGTSFGSSITEPGSPAFWLSFLLMALIAIISVIFYLLYYSITGNISDRAALFHPPLFPNLIFRCIRKFHVRNQVITFSLVLIGSRAFNHPDLLCLINN